MGKSTFIKVYRDLNEPYVSIPRKALQGTRYALSAAGQSLYLYLLYNCHIAQQIGWFGVSKESVDKNWNLRNTSYAKAKQELIEMGYLVQDRKNSSRFYFNANHIPEQIMPILDRNLDEEDQEEDQNEDENADEFDPDIDAKCNILDQNSDQNDQNFDDNSTSLVRNPNQIVRNPNQIVRNPNQIVRNPNQLVRNPNQRDKNLEENDPILDDSKKSLVRNPNQLVRNPNQLVRKTVQLVRNPNQLVRNPAQYNKREEKEKKKDPLSEGVPDGAGNGALTGAACSADISTLTGGLPSGEGNAADAACNLRKNEDPVERGAGCPCDGPEDQLDQEEDFSFMPLGDREEDMYQEEDPYSEGDMYPEDGYYQDEDYDQEYDPYQEDDPYPVTDKKEESDQSESPEEPELDLSWLAEYETEDSNTQEEDPPIEDPTQEEVSTQEATLQDTLQDNPSYTSLNHHDLSSYNWYINHDSIPSTSLTSIMNDCITKQAQYPDRINQQPSTMSDPVFWDKEFHRILKLNPSLQQSIEHLIQITEEKGLLSKAKDESGNIDLAKIVDIVKYVCDLKTNVFNFSYPYNTAEHDSHYTYSYDNGAEVFFVLFSNKELKANSIKKEFRLISDTIANLP